MGNSSGKESRPSQPGSTRSPASASLPNSPNIPQDATDARAGNVYNSRPGRGNRHDVSLLHPFPGSSDRDAPSLEPRRETRQEREARKLEKERFLRSRERDRSMREEGVDGGYLVTLGTYVGPEDFNKTLVRFLQIERRLAPFWKGLNDHSSNWTEHQLVAVARGRTVPAPDEIPPQEDSPPPVDRKQSTSHENSLLGSNDASSLDADAGTVAKTQGVIEEHPEPSSGQSNTPNALFRGRAKPFTSLTSTRNNQHFEITPQEIRLPHEPHVNGQPIEANLYKDVVECPICFLYYPPYLNRTRCCDQFICSECFVQIKRPDPHPPEHSDPNSDPLESAANKSPDEDSLMSEPATCPFCVTPEFGITYDPPPFRRGLAYATNTGSSGPITAVSSSSSLSGGNHTKTPSRRRRNESVSATNPLVITTDKVRPDWAKKLADARAQAARRSAAATALHTAAYMMGPSGSGSGFPTLGRRRRTNLAEIGRGQGIEGSVNPQQVEQLIGVLEGQEASRGNSGRRGTHDLFPGRSSSRTHRAEDLEEMMMMEAIRLSIAAEEDRKKKEEKEAAKEAKKEEKKRAKEQKKADKAARKTGGYSSSANNSGFFSNPGQSSSDLPESTVEGKGKAKAPGGERLSSRPPPALGFTALDEPSSVLHNQRSSSQSRSDSQRHLEQSRAKLDPSPLRRTPSPPGPFQPPHQASTSSSSGSGSLDTGSGHDPSMINPAASEQPSINYGSLAGIVDQTGEGGSAGGNREEGGSGSESSPSGSGSFMDKPQIQNEGTTGKDGGEVTIMEHGMQSAQ